MKVVMQAIFSSICWQIKFSSGAEYWRLGNSDQRSVIIMQATNYCTERKSGRGLYCIPIWQDSNNFKEGKGGLFCPNGNLKPPHLSRLPLLEQIFTKWCIAATNWSIVSSWLLVRAPQIPIGPHNLILRSVTIEKIWFRWIVWEISWDAPGPKGSEEKMYQLLWYCGALLLW